MKKIRPTLVILSTLLVFTLATIAEWFIVGIYQDIISTGLTVIIIIVTFKANSKPIDLTSEQNAHSQKLQSLGQLSSAIAHDFNNILTAIIGNSDLIIERRGEATDNSLKEIYQIRSNAVRGAKLIKQLLAFVRKSSIEFVNLNIHQFLQELEPLFDQIIGKKHKVVIRSHDRGAKVYIDPIQLEQVLINLVVNAKDSMSEGGEIFISSSVINLTSDHLIENFIRPANAKNIEPGQYAQIKVTDSGSGIPKKIIHKIFDPFFSTKDSAGTGLGLATVAQIINKIGGHVLVQSKQDEGTTFLVFLKISEIDADRCDITKTPKEISKIEYSNYNILIVEDEHPVRIFSAHALSEVGFKVQSVQTVEEALEIADDPNQIIDLLLTDVALGAMEGPDLAKIIKSKRPNLKIILTSGYDEGSIEKKDLEDYLFLSKPYSLRELVDHVTRALS